MMVTLGVGDEVLHAKYGIGQVQFEQGDTAIVRFAHGFEGCDTSSLTRRASVEEAVLSGNLSPALEVILKLQAHAIEAINDTWGVFSRSRVTLLPHQLWVCKRVLERWPARWLVADDVGLGKTVEAGLILWPLLSKATVRRVLILCPASLTEQWQYRLREMFDLRFRIYHAEDDTSRSDYWGSHHQVIASLHTLRDNRNGRHSRLLESDPWDLVIVDEAHHLYVDEKTGKTLAFTLLEKLMAHKRVRGAVFFTGTPHRGRDYGFLSLLGLLRSDLFPDPKLPLERVLGSVREVMIRNNKNSVTDLHGAKLFQKALVKIGTYTYTLEEQGFYDLMSEFIMTGQAWAASLGDQERRAVMLVLTALQKLASSSVAAVLRALKRRLGGIEQRMLNVQRKSSARRALQGLMDADLHSQHTADEIARLEEDIELGELELQLMADEAPRLRELISVGDTVKLETKIDRIANLLENELNNEPVLFFTEYKATQSLLMSHLARRFGEDSVTFINGDERADDVIGTTWRMTRTQAAEDFNGGRVRFLVSTEAGGEGIDLQQRCSVLIHIDLPWNPMRLQQRVGRVNRYGQTRRVRVYSFRNPQTVEAKIWEKLEQKIESIQRAHASGMDEPEDLMDLILGMTNPLLFQDLFNANVLRDDEQLAHWFNEKTATFGGADVIEVVKGLLGHCDRFDFQSLGASIPKLDLPDLKPFFVNALRFNRRHVSETDQGLSFKTPDAWLEPIGIVESYAGLVFDRTLNGRDAGHRILGVGHKLVTQALEQAKSLEASAGFSAESSEGLLLMYSITDRVTEHQAMRRSVIASVKIERNGQLHSVSDADCLILLNALLERGGGKRAVETGFVQSQIGTALQLEQAKHFLENFVYSQLEAIERPQARLIGVLAL